MLKVIRFSWDGLTESTHNQIMKGLADFLESSPDININLLIKKLSKVKPYDLRIDGDHAIKKNLGGYQAVIKGIYNHNQKSNII